MQLRVSPSNKEFKERVRAKKKLIAHLAESHAQYQVEFTVPAFLIAL
jgi:hypothetical protein